MILPLKKEEKKTGAPFPGKKVFFVDVVAAQKRGQGRGRGDVSKTIKELHRYPHESSLDLCWFRAANANKRGMLCAPKTGIFANFIDLGLDLV